MIGAYMTTQPARPDYEAVRPPHPRSSAERVDHAVTRSLDKAAGEADGKKLDALKQALAEAQERLRRPAPRRPAAMRSAETGARTS
jgi:hypothetical protein